ncbi:BCCT family transporter [Sediminibacillus albus]|uniref:BCCT family transporter n=1 Tax=Sediminibacillus albus TaxID=407036 RepID=UPI002481F25D|nr:BCCT family transporter [Sediminibacillus albus]
MSVTVLAGFVLWGAAAPSHMSQTSSAMLDWMIANFSWFYMFATTIYVGFCFYLAFSSHRKIKLGKQDSEPAYSFFSWIGMLFAAGMGVGLVFWGVAEPISHYASPPPGIEAETDQAAKAALKYSVFHWTIQPWAIYAIIGMAIAYFKFRKGRAGLISHAFHPLIGDRVNGPAGKVINIIATLATAIGIATTFGLSAMQVSGGLSEVFGTPNNSASQMVVIAVVGILFMAAVMKGLDKGIRMLSNANLGLAAVLLAAVIVLGPTIFILDNLASTLGNYLRDYLSLSLEVNPYANSGWQGQWTIFYWAWLIAWSPFVGTFIARVSRGRTIQEFILGALLFPALLGAVWFVAFGGTAIHLQMFQGANLAEPAQKNAEVALFIMLDQLPLGTVLSVLGLLLITIFFATSAASATYVLGMLSSKGTLNPRKSTQTVWGLLIAGTAAILLLSGGLEALQAVAVVTALPFAVLILMICISLGIELRRESKRHSD